jgi:hypothetical protein
MLVEHHHHRRKIFSLHHRSIILMFLPAIHSASDGTRFGAKSDFSWTIFFGAKMRDGP